jgi:hypothetical protein
VNVAAAGSYNLKIRYAAEFGDKPNYIYVNATSLGEKTFTLSSTFTELNVGTISLNAGNNTIKVEKSWGWVDVDYFKVEGGSTPTPTPVSTNVALNKTATANSFVTGEEPAKAVDGSKTTKWCADVAGDKWLKIDLGQNYDISRWVVTHAGSESSSFITKDFKLQKSADGTTWVDVDLVTGNTVNVTDRTVTKFNTRYVRLYITIPTQTTNQAARIYEFEVYSP